MTRSDLIGPKTQQLRSKRPAQASPLALLVFHVAPAQRGKPRLYQATELLFEAADDIVEGMAKAHARTLKAGLFFPSQPPRSQQSPIFPPPCSVARRLRALTKMLQKKFLSQ